MSVSESVDNRPTFHSERHVRYWLRCLKTVLPTEYTSNDSNRMTLGFFILAAFDLLDILHTKTTAAERQSCVDWIYHCQHPKGGFRGFPGTDFGGLRTADNAHWDPASLPGTYFALLTLAVLGDDLRRMHKRKCLAWMRRLQREDGSFGEMLGLHGKIEGNRDTRFCYFAASVRWMLGCGKRKSRTSTASDIDVGALVQYINACETFDHGYSEAPHREAHGGLAFCAIGTLAMLDRLPQSVANKPLQASEGAEHLVVGLRDLERTLHWLVSRQVAYVDEDEDDELESETGFHHTPGLAHNQHECSPQTVDTPRQGTPATHPLARPMPVPAAAGFNGRCNKDADTCYSFWVCGSLDMLGHVDLISQERSRRFLLQQTQHRIGGFGKEPGSIPDLMHSYLGLTALAIMGEPGLQPIHAALCVSKRTVAHLEELTWEDGEGDEPVKDTL